MVGRLVTTDLREIWKHEALNFTTWLFENCDVLNEQTGLSLSPLEKEKSVGPFYVDILAQDASGRLAIIENQLSRTDHDHLGKVLTYLTNLDAKIAIWISIDPRPEHVTAINYLNEVVPQDTMFYLLKLQAYKIGDSDSAPLFTIVAGPSIERSAGGEVKKDVAENDKKRFEFFNQLLKVCNKKTTLFSNISPVGYQSFINASTGKSGILWGLVAMKKASRIDLAFCGVTSEINRVRFKLIANKKLEIEKAFGESLIWDFNEDRKQQYLRWQNSLGGIDDEMEWSNIHHDLAEKLALMEKTLNPYIKNLNNH